MFCFSSFILQHIFLNEIMYLNRFSLTKLLKMSKEFYAQNISLNKRLAMTQEEADIYQTKAWQKNEGWLKQYFELHNLEWIMVIDNNVIDCGHSSDSYPSDEKILSVAKKYDNKFPFIFVKSPLIEEYMLN